MSEKPVGIPFFDRTRGDAEVMPELEEAFRRVVRSGRYILGPEVEALESELAAYLGVSHAIGVSSGTDALLAALMAIGVGPGDEVICPAYTFFATVEGVVRLGAKPVFVDVSERTLTMDPAQLEERIGPRTRAIIPVHLFGTCAEMVAIVEVARAHGVVVIEDAAQAMGASLGARKAGSLGDLGCFSFFPTKNLGGFGDGGLVTTNDAALAGEIRSIRNHGSRTKLVHDRIGGNFRLDELQAALLRAVLPRLDRDLARRRAIAAAYRTLFAERRLEERVRPIQADAGSTFNQFLVRIRGGEGTRDRVRRSLADRSVGTALYYATPASCQPCLGSGERFAVSEAASRETLALPIFPDLTSEEIRGVVAAISDAFAEGEP